MLHPIISRRYATSAKRIVEHSHYDLHAWPATKHPTPQEIFQLSHTSADFKNQLEYEKAVRATYQKFVKIYHPDVCCNHNVLDASGNHLLATQLRQRFESIQDAYDVMKNPRTASARLKYDSTSWSDYKPGKTSSFEAFRMANAHRKQFSYEQDPQFWQAATWEDYYQMRYGRSAPTQEEWEKNKWLILWKVLAVASVVVAIQIMMALERAQEYRRQTRLMNLRADAQLSDAYTNYDEDRSPFQRLRRFLLYRRLGLSEANDKDVISEENNILTGYAKRRLKRQKKKEEQDEMEKVTALHEEQSIDLETLWSESSETHHE